MRYPVTLLTGFVSKLMVTPEGRVLTRRARHQRTLILMKVRIMDVGRVWDGMLCACVNEEGRDGGYRR